MLLSRLIGQPAVGRDGRPVGRLADLTVRLDENGSPHLVDRLVLRLPGGRMALLPRQAVDAIHVGRLVVTTEPDGFDPKDLADALGAGEILLKRDVLDTQVVDIVGQRLARVADVVLARTRSGRLELLGVEVGFSGVLRRLGLRTAPAAQDVVAWPDLHLTSERGHKVQLSTPRSAVHRLNARTLAALVSRVDTDSATEILAAEEPAMAAEAVRAAHPAVGERLLRAMRRHQADRIVDSMPAEHASRWRERLALPPAWRGRRFLRSGVWPHRRHLIRERRA